jgi:hypothetical protein
MGRWTPCRPSPASPRSRPGSRLGWARLGAAAIFSPARYFPGASLKFDANGRRVGAPLILVQWQNGEPVTVAPPQFAVAKAIWTKQSSE